MFANFIEFFLKGLACFGTVILLLWVIRWESASYAIFLREGGSRTSSLFYMIKLLSRNQFFNQKSMGWLCVISLFSLVGAFLPFMAFPLCENIFWQGRDIFTEYFRTETGLILVFLGIMVNHVCVGVVKNYQKYHGQNMYIASRLACFISSMGILFVILLSLFLTYESFDFHEIVRRQNSFFGYGLFLQPVAAILFFGCMQIEGNTRLFSVPEKNDYNGVEGIEVFFLKLLEKTRWLCLMVIYVFVFLGGYSLLPGLEHIVEIFPKILHIGQFVSLVFKVSLVSFVAIIVKYSFLERREVDSIRWAFGKCIPLAFVNFAVTVGIKFYI